MKLPPFPTEALTLPDDELGQYFLAYYIMAQADFLDLPLDSIPHSFARRVVEFALTSETVNAKNAAIEKALHKAASGDYPLAGKLLREHMTSGAVTMKFVPIGIERVKQQSKFGRKGAEAAKAEGKDNGERIFAEEARILAGRTRKPSQNNLAKLISEKTGIPLPTVRGHLTRRNKTKKVD